MVNICFPDFLRFQCDPVGPVLEPHLAFNSARTHFADFREPAVMNALIDIFEANVEIDRIDP